MKATKKLLSIILAISILFAMPITAQAGISMKSPYNSTTYTISDAQSGKIIRHGIDVSEHNGTIDWQTVKNYTDFAIIRIGYRGYGDKGTMLKDKKFDENIEGAKENGIPVGIYFYSQAVNEKEAIEEANITLEWLNSIDLEYPIFYDYEFAGVSSGRLDSAWKSGKIDQGVMTDNAIAFMDTIKVSGYETMIYASRTFLYDNVDNEVITNEGYGIWVAEYNTSTKFTGQYNGWQYSSSGSIKGISGRIDCNFWFDENNKLEDCYYTGQPIMPTPDVVINGITLTPNIDYTLSYTNNIEVGLASVTVTGIGQYASMTPYVLYFKILPNPVTGLIYTNRTANSISVQWDMINPSYEYDVQVYRGGMWTDYSSSILNSMTITGLKTASIYNIRVRAKQNVGGIYYNGEYSPCIKVATVPDKMSKPVATPSSNSIKLTWSKLGNANGYQLYKYNSSTKTYDLLAETQGTSYTDKNLKLNTTYYYKIKAYKVDSNGEVLYGGLSNKLTAKTASTVPTASKATSPKKKQLKLSWKKVSGVTGYQVQWSTSKNFSSNKKAVFVKGANATSKTVQTAQSKKKYYIRVRSYKTKNNKKQYSSWSKTLSVKVK